MKDFNNIFDMWTSLKSRRDQYKPLWDQISKYTGIGVRPDYAWSSDQGTNSRALDEFVDDPTSAISVNQGGDYMIGIVWGTGDKAFSIRPSRYVLELVDQSEVQDYFNFITDQTLYHMNHSQAGFNTALRPYMYDQVAFGTSGVGAFPNKGFVNRVEENALVFRNYGIDNMVIDEGKSGLVEYVFSNHRWKCNQIVGEFCTATGTVDNKAVSALPRSIREAYRTSNLNQEFNLVFGTFPRSDFNPRLKGAKGTRYRGVWFLDDPNEGKIFFEESFGEKPIAVCRQIKMRGESYGRSSGTMLISTIRSVNFMVALVIEIMEKMGNPPLGVFNNAMFGDAVMDSSPNGLTVFNSTLANNGNPAFPLYDIGDPSAIVQFLIPYLNEKITTAFKIDALLDFSSAKEMTATESLQRYAIRGKSLAGMLQQQKIEFLEPISKRSISILYNLGELGINPRTQAQAARTLKVSRPDRVIPDAILKVIDEGRPWYELKFNNELEKLTRTESIQNLLQVLQAIGGIASLYPQIVEAVDWYTLLEDINNNLDANNKILYTAEVFKKKLADAAAQQRAVLLAQASKLGSEVDKNTAQANKDNQQATNGR